MDQRSRFPALAGRLARLAMPALCALALSCAAVSMARAQNASGWARGPLSTVRLIGGEMKGGVWRAGIEITLKAGAHTYWRSPGDSGVPPAFDFAGSANLKSAKVRFPLPQRLDEAGMQIFGYKNEVVFPLDLVAADATRPVAVALHFSYAACEKICIPAEARLKLTLDPRRQNGGHEARIAEFAARTPRPLDAPDAPALTIAASGKKSWRVTIAPPGGEAEDILAEGPDGWIFDTKRIAPGVFALKLAEKPADAADRPPPVTLTIVTSAGAFEGTKHLDATGAKP